MNFLTLTSFIGEPQGYSDSPDFRNQIWPLLIKKREEIRGVFLFMHDTGPGSVSWTKHYELASPNIILLGSMNRLADEDLTRLAHWSFFGGHLNVLYQVMSDSSMFLELFQLYPSINLSSDNLDQLGLEEHSLFELRSFIAKLSRESVVLSFAHDADPLYIFGDLEMLRSLLRGD